MWIASLGIENADSFVEQKIIGQILKRITKDDLEKDLGIETLGERYIILKAIENLDLSRPSKKITEPEDWHRLLDYCFDIDMDRYILSCISELLLGDGSPLYLKIFKPITEKGHHLHIRNIEVLSTEDEKLKLELSDASEYVLRGSSNKQKPDLAIDGNLSTYNHSDYGPHCTPPQDHWMQFQIKEEKLFDKIGSVTIWNRTDCKGRIIGADLELMSGERILWSHTFQKHQNVYEFKINGY